MSFEPFGWRRNWNTMANLDAASAGAFNTRPRTSRGFTGHEQVDNLGLIHMNGRMYDPWVGRFVQADPIVQDYGNPQSLNRYSYVLNNPLSFTDPTGYASMNATWRSVVAIAVIAFSGGWAAGIYASLPALSTSAAWAVAISGGAIAGAVQTGTMRGAMIGAVSAAAFHGIGSYYRSMAAANAANGTADAVYRGLTAPQLASNVALSSVAGGVMSDLQGGKFGHGMVSAGLSTAASPAFDHISSPAGQVVVAAMIGGTASSVTGGRFANGAVTAAFAQAFSSVASAATESLAGDAAGAIAPDVSRHFKASEQSDGNDLTLLDRRSKHWINASRASNDPDIVEVIAHGGRSGTYALDSAGRRVDAVALEGLIRQHTDFAQNPRTVRLRICFAGKGSESLGQVLADRLDQRVAAPTTQGLIYSSGRYGVQRPGQERVFVPRDQE